MSHLVDVDLLLAAGWRSHARHAEARAWLLSRPAWHVCPLVETGFLRVSMSPAYKASFADARKVLRSLVTKQNAHFLPDDVRAESLPTLQGARQVSDAYLVALAREHQFKLATLDEPLTAQPWAKDIAETPLPPAADASS